MKNEIEALNHICYAIDRLGHFVAYLRAKELYFIGVVLVNPDDDETIKLMQKYFNDEIEDMLAQFEFTVKKITDCIERALKELNKKEVD